MIRTHGLTHLNLTVADLDRAVRFYTDVFGVKEYYRDASSVQVLGPGPHDVIAFELGPTPAQTGSSGGVTHFGFRLIDPKDIDAAVEHVTRAGGMLLRRGEFNPHEPYAYIHDPDGYEIEIWFEGTAKHSRGS
jgi:catechol 2,3-dioxygenase-like lactoylglutathione lyase family enzyme